MCIYIQRYSQLTSTTTDRNCVRVLYSSLLFQSRPQTSCHLGRERNLLLHMLYLPIAVALCVLRVWNIDWPVMESRDRPLPRRALAALLAASRCSTAPQHAGWLAGWLAGSKATANRNQLRQQPQQAARLGAFSLSVCTCLCICVCVCSARRITLIYTHAEKFNPNVI